MQTMLRRLFQVVGKPAISNGLRRTTRAHSLLSRATGITRITPFFQNDCVWDTMAKRHASIQGNDLKKGVLIELDGNVFEVLKTQHVRSGKGGAFVQADIRNLKGGSKVTKRFRSKGEKINEIVLDEVADFQVLEKTETSLTLMHTTTFEQTTIDRSLVGDGILMEGMVLNVSFSEGQVSRSSTKFVNCSQAIIDISDAGPASKTPDVC